MQSENSPQLSKGLSVFGAVSMAFGMVIGAGLLVLPGMAYNLAGPASIYAWIVCSVIVIPLLVVFSYLGATYPGAGGISGFVRVAFGARVGAATDLVLIGTFSLGIPAIAWVGGSYFLSLIGQPDNKAVGFLISSSLLILAGLVNLKGLKTSSIIQQLVTFSLVILLFGITGISIFSVLDGISTGPGIAPLSELPNALPVIGIVFFAFTGWELLSFTTEEYKNPKRDYPISVVVSFVTVTTLYLGIVWSLQSLVPPDHLLRCMTNVQENVSSFHFVCPKIRPQV